jgi:SAM-dependent methyltransferase
VSSAQSFLAQLGSGVRGWWREHAAKEGRVRAIALLSGNLWEFVLDSTPARRRQRYGDMEYDWEKRVNTTSGTVGWRARLLGVFHSPYQPTEPELFREMMGALPIELERFTFVDIGSGKGRTLLMASEFPFKKIVGVELIEELHRAAEENIRAYRAAASADQQPDERIEPLLGDARRFDFPKEPLLVYLFNPLPEAGLQELIARLKESVGEWPRPVWIVYHNALLEGVLSGTEGLAKMGGAEQYSIYAF